MRVRPISREALVEELAELISARPQGSWVRVAVDGAPPARPGALADELVAPLRLRGRPVLRVSAGDFLRPASLRLEYGRTDPDAYYDDWLDAKALRREVLDPLEPGGSGRVLPALWDSGIDRAYRVPYTELPSGGVVLVDGALLLGRGLAFEVSVHVWLSPKALERGTGEGERWTLPAYERYEREARPQEVADVVVRADHPERPAVLVR
ncbi:nucleoside/nucleotide kinase family protein [Nonomuraea gerenzanensis]|uniref:Uridine kinase n=1 Tax=Nonomuraea gerenzanensis TaxID=93944 RepID=A0A1M4EM33_9ACTN|nr:uridine kinase [Nonomuraea gerenzanensis]UBU11164.1 uridine kinase [Nonomuraea gerenzanensis]SBO99633.1 Uridine kinase [Nonomuraea gerenzanensis]